MSTHVFEDIESETAAAGIKVIDDDDAFVVLSRIACAWGNNAVLNDVGWRLAAIPHESVEVCYMNDGDSFIVDCMPGVGRHFLRRIVLEIDGWCSSTLFVSQNFILVVRVLSGGLEKNTVQTIGRA